MSASECTLAERRSERFVHEKWFAQKWRDLFAATFDGLQVVSALVVTPGGGLLSYAVFAGNTLDRSTHPCPIGICHCPNYPGSC